jgi:hypothetical protein
MSKTGEIRSWNLSPQDCDGILPEIYLQEHTLGVYILRVVFGFRGTEKRPQLGNLLQIFSSVPYLIVSRFLFGFLARQLKMTVRL